MWYREDYGLESWKTPRARNNFSGQCFRCGAWRHMQFECPLTQCRNCHEYGHEDTRCRRRGTQQRFRAW